jgi:hypothetical protein
VDGKYDNAIKSTLKQSVADSLKGAVPQQTAVNTDDGSVSPNNASLRDSTILALSGADPDAINSHVRPCWNIDVGAPDASDFRVKLFIATNASGTVQEAAVAPEIKENYVILCSTYMQTSRRRRRKF